MIAIAGVPIIAKIILTIRTASVYLSKALFNYY